MTRYAYDESRDPPAPVLPIRVGPPGRAPDVFLTALVDTGADLSVVPASLAIELHLPPVSQIEVQGAGGLRSQATVYAAEVETDKGRLLAEVIGLGEQVLVGRDVLNRWDVTLHGPERVMEIAGGSPP